MQAGSNHQCKSVCHISYQRTWRTAVNNSIAIWDRSSYFRTENGCSFLLAMNRKERPPMTKKKTPQTIEECNAELELTQKKIRQYENRSKMLDRRLAIEKRKERNHRLCSRGGFIESIVPELITMTDEDAQTFFRLALTSEPAREFLRKRAGETTS